MVYYVINPCFVEGRKLLYGVLRHALLKLLMNAITQAIRRGPQAPLSLHA